MPQMLKEKIVSVETLAEGIVKMVIHSPYTVENAKPGQFVNIKCQEGLDAFLRRPISICELDKTAQTVTIVFQVKGKGTKFLAEKKPGDVLDMIAPLGWGVFDLAQHNKKVAIVGGGIGVFPLYELAKQLKGVSASTTTILGFRNKDLVVMEPEFAGVSNQLLIATDDGSYGIKGFTTDLLEQEIQEKGVEQIFACGPMPMLKRIAAIADRYGISCQVSLEERMGCGIGACLVCACKTTHGDEWEHSHVCYNGPVFDSKEVVFDD